MNKIYDDVDRVLIDKASLERRVSELGAEITRDYAGKELLVVCILKGSTIFYADLVRAIDLDVRFDFMAVSSYGSGTTSSGSLNIKKDLANDIEGKDVLLVEDIIDSGNTLNKLKKILLERHPHSLKVCALLDKPSRRVVEMEGDYIGFTVGDEFIIGYGLDYAEKYRNIGEVCVIKDEAIH